MSKGFQMFAILLCLILGICTSAYATHLRAADIVVERVCGSLTFKITVVAYLNSTSTTRFGHGQLVFGDGQSYFNGDIEATLRPELGTNISVATFTIMHTYQTSGVYMIAYIEGDRNAGVLNIANSHDVAYLTAVTIDTNPKFGCNRFPVLTIVPLDRGCSATKFFHIPGAQDADGDSLSYELTTPSKDLNIFADYVDPNDSRFYTNFNQGNEEKTGTPTFTINDSTGLVTWDAPGAVGEYAMAFKVIEWRKDSVTQKYEKISTTIRDMQVIIDECTNLKPDLMLPEDLCVIAGESVNGIITGTDPDNHNVKIELFSELLELDPASSPPTYSPDTSLFVPSNPPAEVRFQWNTACLHVRQQPYQIVVKITDSPPEGPKLVNFKTWHIRVVSPPPVLKEADLNVVKNYGVLSWENSSCGAAKTQVWRKVGPFPYTPNPCILGIPRKSGYTLIAELNGTQTSFIDTNYGNGLSPGAQYCYRLVSLVADTKSIVSSEICIGPVKMDAPVITHVSVEKTDTEGDIRVSWRSPLDINRDQFPEPYEYEIFRATGFFGDDQIKKVARTQDTTLVDSIINTIEGVYNYRIVVYSKPKFSDAFIAVDTSAVASSVKLFATAGFNKIELHWQDSVPWSNIVHERPYHLIYRGDGIVLEESLVLIDSVNVIEDGFTYVDEGQHNDEPLGAKIYTYRILTQGTYGNVHIPLQKNFSQIVSLYPENDLVPCQPIGTVNITDCETYVNSNTCAAATFSNVVSWSSNLMDTCRVDIVGYRIYASDTPDGEFSLAGMVSGISNTTFTDENLTSPARCYRISAIDGSEQEGPQSEPVCNDACPYFVLPNVFTPNADGCNDVFAARFNPENSPGEQCSPLNIYSCPRFVRTVSLTVYNRWGKQVYRYQSDADNSVNVDWNGKDNDGGDLASGIYYYVAEVDFNVLDEEKKHKTIKEWVHLIR